MSATNKQWTLIRRPVGDDVDACLRFEEKPKPEVQPGQMLVRTGYLSLDPANRLWMKDEPSYMPPVPLGGPMYGGIIGTVEASAVAGFAPGDLVTGLGGWAEYHLFTPGEVGRVTPVAGVPLSAWMSVLGATGITAYFGLLEVGKPKAGETLVVSAAAGAVGSIVGQIGKIMGCRVIGIAGGAEKCRYLKTRFGFDEAIDYKNENVAARLAQLAPPRADGGGGVDMYFENTGGEIGNAVIENIALRGRVMLCGLISQYNAKERVQGVDLTKILMRRATIEGFLVLDYFPRAAEAVSALSGWIRAGQLVYDVDVRGGIENALSAFHSLFAPGGGHTGKLMVRIDPGIA